MINEFRNYLFSKSIANDKNVGFYIMWVKKYLEFQKSSAQDDAKDRNIDYFIKGLSNNYFDWHIDPAYGRSTQYRLFSKSQAPEASTQLQIPIPYCNLGLKVDTLTKDDRACSLKFRIALPGSCTSDDLRF